MGNKSARHNKNCQAGHYTAGNGDRVLTQHGEGVKPVRATTKQRIAETQTVAIGAEPIECVVDQNRWVLQILEEEADSDMEMTKAFLTCVD